MTDKEKIELIKEVVEYTVSIGSFLGYLSFEGECKVEEAAIEGLLEKFGLEEEEVEE